MLCLVLLFVLCLAKGDDSVSVAPALGQGVLPMWGTFRPNVYFGVKARIQKSPMFGIMWYDADKPFDYESG
jgi:hypothetical protein